MVRSLHLASLIVVLVASLGTDAMSQNPYSHPDDIYWSNKFASPGLANPAPGVASPTTLYTTGRFSLPAPGLNFTGFRPYILATWDGSGWNVTGPGELLASGLPTTPFAIAVDATGIFVGGLFTHIDAQPFNNIAAWNGAQWQSLRNGVDGVVNVVKATGTGTIYVGGAFGFADTLHVGNVALWDGNQWERLYDVGGLAYGTNGQVRDIALTSSTAAYLVGDFGLGGAQPVDRFARWSRFPSAWTSYAANFQPQGNNVVSKVGNWGSSTYVAGQFTAINSQTLNGIARLDIGSGTWDSLAGGSQIFVQELEVAPTGDVYAIGGFTEPSVQLGRWSGVNWQIVPTELVGVDIIAQGSGIYNLNGLQVAGKQFNGAGRWDGATWHSLGQGIGDWQGSESDGIYTMVRHNGQLHVGGFFGSAGGQRIQSLAKWNGSVWVPVDSVFSGQVKCFASVGSTLYVGGSVVINGVPFNGIGAWDGSTWSSMAGGLSGSAEAMLHDGQYLYVYDFGSPPRVKRWDGNTWSNVGLAFSSSEQTLAFAKLGSDLYAGGAFFAGPLYRWNGTSWTLVPGLAHTSTPIVYAMKTRGNDIYIGGSFLTANGVTVNNIVRWDGANWNALGSGLNGDVRSIEFDAQGNLYAGGQFGTVSTGTTDTLFSVAKWDGTRWTRLGTGVFNTPILGFPAKGLVRAMAGTSDGLFLGGLFTHVGDKYSKNVALWTDYTLTGVIDPGEERTSSFALSQNYPNPFNPATNLKFSIVNSQLTILKIYDLLGREVATLVNEMKEPGSYEVTFDASGLASGVYFYRLQAGEFVQTKKLILMK